MVVTTFTHDIGDMLTPNHDSAAAAAQTKETRIRIIRSTKAVFDSASVGVRRRSTQNITHWVSRFVG